MKSIQEILTSLWNYTVRNSPNSINENYGRKWMTVKLSYLQKTMPWMTMDDVATALSSTDLVYTLGSDRFYVSLAKVETKPSKPAVCKANIWKFNEVRQPVQYPAEEAIW